MKSSTKNKPSSGQVPDFAPGDMAFETSRKYFETGSQAKIDRNRWFFISLFLATALVAQSFGLSLLLPLKQVEPYGITQVEGGRLVVEQTPIGKWEPDKDAMAYFLNKWVNNVFDINRSTIEKTLTEASEVTIGTAVAQLRELRTNDNPIVLLRDNPNYNRSYEYRSINFIKDDVALLRFKTTERKNDAVKEVNYAMTITFSRIKPKTREQLIRNPAGLYINNFHLTEESTK